MVTKIFVNLPVKDLNKSVEFFTWLGFTFDPRFTDKNATCMILGENMYVMLLVEEFFKTFIPNSIADTSKSTESIVALFVESRAKVDQMVDSAIKAGGKESRKPQDQANMFVRSFQDLDGHLWEIFYMDVGSL